MPRFSSLSRRPSLPASGLAVLLILLLCLPAVARADLAGDVTARARRALATGTPRNATVAVQLVALEGSLESRQVLFAQSADRPMIPASNLKLLTTAAALDGLGKDFKFRTLLLARGNPARGEVELAVIGDGDPSFGDATLLRPIDGWDTTTVFQNWASALRQSGITRISALYLDDGIFDQEHVNENWPLNQRHLWYEAQVGALTLNINCLDVHLTRNSAGRIDYRLDPPTRYVTVENTCRVGQKNAVALTRGEGSNTILLSGQTNARQQGPLRVTIHDPSQYFGAVLAETIGFADIETPAPIVDRTIRLGWEAQQRSDPDSVSPGAWRLLAIHQTELGPVLARTNKDSINLYAEALAKRLAFAKTAQPGSWPAAEAAVREYLSRIGREADHVVMDDGSGMSRLNRVSAAALCDVLSAQHLSDAAEIFRASLSAAGEDGTLETRFRGADRSDLRGRVFGKTGYINGVSTFSGYLHGRDGNWYAFSVLVNDCPAGEIGKAKLLQEDLVLAIDRSLEPAASTAAAR